MALIVLFFSLRKSKKAVELSPASVEWLGEFSEQVSCGTFARPLDEHTLSVQKGGRLEQLLVVAGQEVQAGQVLATVEETTNAADLKGKLSEFRLASKEFARIRGLMSSGSGTREDYDRALGDLEVKRANLERAKQTLEDAVVRSPADGVVQSIVFKAGDKVPDGGRLGMVYGRSGFRAACRFLNTVVRRIPSEVDAILATQAGKPGEPSSGDLNLRATIEQDDTRSGASNGFVGVDREIRFVFHELPPAIKFGNPVKLTFALPAVKEVARIPSLAVVTRTDGEYVLERVEGGALRWLPVTVFKRDPQGAVITGIAPDTKILQLDRDLNEIESLVKASASKAAIQKG